MNLQLKLCALMLTSVASASTALAHHSFAMFDKTKEVEISGTVKQFRWTNPHIFLHVEVAQEGKPVVYTIEGSNPNSLSSRGWKRTTFKPGDKVTVVLNPLKSGQPGGSFVRGKTADGTKVEGNSESTGS